MKSRLAKIVQINLEQIKGLGVDETLSLYQTDLSSGIKDVEAGKRQIQFGFNEVPEKKTSQILKFLKKFWGVTAWMLELIILLSFLLNKLSDAYIVIGLLVFNAIIGFIQEQNAAKAVEALKNKLHINAKVLRGGDWKTVPSRELVPGDIIRVRIGDFVPADVKITCGDLGVDQSALTGESLESEKRPGEVIFSGSIIKRGEATGIVVLTGVKTYFGRTVELVQIAKPKLHIESIISRVTQWLLIIVAILLSVALIASLLQGVNPIEILPLMLVLLLGAVPVALPAMFTVSMALGSLELVKKGVLVTRLSAPDDAAQMDVLCVDKTGTITLNQLTVAKIIPIKPFNEDDVLLYGALASQKANRDPIDLAFIEAAEKKNISTQNFDQVSFAPFDPKTRHTEALVKKDNEEMRVLKGAFETFAQVCQLDQERKKELENLANESAAKGYRTLAVAISRGEERPDLIGLVALHDPPRKDSRRLLQEIRNLGVKVKMLTGDALPIAKEIASVVGIGNRIVKAADLKIRDKSDEKKTADLIEESDGFAEVYPEDKYLIVKALQTKGHIVGMTGDGVNDAPALKQAEVGVAVSSATDVAKGAASIVLTDEGLIDLLEPIRIGRMMFQRINTWILNKISRTVLKTCFVVIAFLILGKFVITASAMLVMIFMTDFVKISLSTDNVRWSKNPSKWDITGLVKTAVILGGLMVVEAFSLLFVGLKYFNLALNDGALSTYCFEILFFFAIFSIFVVREKKHFWSSAPSKFLLTVMLMDIILGFSFVTFGLLGFTAIPIAHTLFVFGFAFLFSLVINDLIKFYILEKWGLA
jgi:H+-transporting ATPase